MIFDVIVINTVKSLNILNFEKNSVGRFNQGSADTLKNI